MTGKRIGAELEIGAAERLMRNNNFEEKLLDYESYLSKKRPDIDTHLLMEELRERVNPTPPKPPECELKFWDRRWPRLRQFVIKRDEGKCQECGSREELEVHHIQPRRHGGRDAPSNLRTLCKECHTAITIADMEREGWLRRR
jgi:hypothetical protein